MMRLFNWFRRGSLERELDHELQYHFDRRVADLTAAGIREAEARRHVTIELGLFFGQGFSGGFRKPGLAEEEGFGRSQK